MDRLEFKYLIPRELLPNVRKALLPFVTPDPFTQGQCPSYTVRSIYFDTLSLNDYYEKEAGIQHRKKIRIRAYNQGFENAPVFLEIKRKNNMAISKHRASVSFQNMRYLFASGNIEDCIQNPKAQEEARRFFYHIYRYALRPTVFICYEREAFFQTFDNTVRITIDKNLRSMPFPKLEDLYRETGALFSLPAYVVLEIKFRKGIPAYVQTILEHFRLERTPVSKYAISLDTHRIPERGTSGCTADAFAGHTSFKQSSAIRQPFIPLKTADYGT